MMSKILYKLSSKYLAKEVNINIIWKDINNEIQSTVEIPINIEHVNLIFSDKYGWCNWQEVNDYILSDKDYIKIMKNVLTKEWTKLRKDMKKGLPIKNDRSIIDSRIIVKIVIEIGKVKYKKLTYEEWKRK